jgi:SAM-dependent methyltransferase
MTDFDQAVRRAWAGRAEPYARGFAKLCAYPIPQLLDVADVAAGDRVLDVGTGTGNVAALACERGAKATAVDAEPSMVELASRAVPGASVQLAVLPQLPFSDAEFDVVIANFVLNHVGRPRATLAELRRVTRPGGRIALTIWAVPVAAGQTLIGRAIEAAGVPFPSHQSSLPPEEDFQRDEQGFAAFLTAAGLSDADCRTLAWDHRATAEEWWSGPAAGVASVGQVLVSQSAPTVAEIKRHFDRLSVDVLGPDGRLVLPHRALLAWGSP